MELLDGFVEVPDFIVIVYESKKDRNLKTFQSHSQSRSADKCVICDLLLKSSLQVKDLLKLVLNCYLI